jgi:hypothetical protein
MLGLGVSDGIRASLRDAGLWGSGPGDKSPGYCHMSLRDEESSQEAKPLLDPDGRGLGFQT